MKLLQKKSTYSLKSLLTTGAITFILTMRGMALEYYVDNTVGDDGFSGSSKTVAENRIGPFRTITKAALAAKAGDTVHVIPTGELYREMLNLYGMKNGESGNPITIDGHGVTITGAEICPPQGWQTWKDDVMVRDDLPFSGMLIVDGELVFETQANNILQPGELYYGTPRLFFKPKDKTVPDIEVGQPDGSSVKLDPKAWQNSGISGVLRYNGLKTPTWVKMDNAEVKMVVAKERLLPGQFSVDDKKLYYRPPLGKTVASMDVKAAIRLNGIQIGGNTTYVIIKNFNVRHVYDDGYNVHGSVKHVEFINCNAYDCGDQGFSSHDTCETLVEGALYTRCTDGVLDVNRSVTTFRNVTCANNRRLGIGANEQASHVLDNIILDDNPSQLSSAGGGSLEMDNVLIVRTPGGPVTTALGLAGTVKLSHLTVAGNSSLLRYMGGTGISMESCLFAGGQAGLHYRMDDVITPFMLKNVRFGEEYKLEYGGKPPFKTETIQQWLSDLKEAGKEQDVTVEDMRWTVDIVNGKMPEKLPEGIGCTKELIARYCDFMKEKLK